MLGVFVFRVFVFLFLFLLVRWSVLADLGQVAAIILPQGVVCVCRFYRRRRVCVA